MLRLHSTAPYYGHNTALAAPHCTTLHHTAPHCTGAASNIPLFVKGLEEISTLTDQIKTFQKMMKKNEEKKKC